MSRIPVTSPPSFAPYRRRSSTSATIFPSSSRKKRFCTNFVAANRMELHLSEQRSRVFCVPFLLSRLSMTTVASSLLTIYPLRNAMLDHPGTRIVTIVFFNVRWFFVSLPVALHSTNLFSMKFIIDRINQDCYRYFSGYKTNWELNFCHRLELLKFCMEERSFVERLESSRRYYERCHGDYYDWKRFHRGNSLSSRNNINFHATIKLSVIKVEKVQCSFSIIRETCSSFPFSARPFVHSPLP